MTAEPQELPFSGIAEPVGDDAAHDFRPSRELDTGLRTLPFTDTKKVVKQWGQERWLHEADNGAYAFKVIRIKAGRRTSLHYHVHKKESNFVLEGSAVLRYRSRPDAEEHQVPLPVGTLVHVDPLSVHRVEAVTDVVLVEVSTYDDGTDTVRVTDDYGRGDGLISEEH
jgi:mannose-6-phosphate isomerase-like protein (cupin superfamily)